MIHAQQGDPLSRDLLVTQNTGLVWSVVRRLGRRGYDAEDLFQIGTIGLIKAIDRFDLRFQTSFSTYAVPLIFGELRRFLRDDGLIKVSRTLKEQSARLQKARQTLEHQLGRTPTLAELARHAGLSPAEVSAALASCEDAVSLDAPIASGSAGKELTVQDVLPDPGPGEEDRGDRLSRQEALTRLPETEAALIRLRYFQNQTQTQAGAALGLSQVQVSRLEKKVLLKLRQEMTQE